MSINRIFMKGAIAFVALLVSGSLSAQQTYNEMELLTVNENVTTVITSSEPIRLVDISTDKVVGDKPIENVIRLKPKQGGYEDGEVLAIVTVVARSQYEYGGHGTFCQTYLEQSGKIQERQHQAP